MEAFEERMRLGGAAAVKEATGFFMRDDPVHGALEAIARRLDAEGVAYAVAGGMALVAHGYDRTTVDIDVLVSEGGLQTIQQRLVGRGYRPAFEGSRKQGSATRSGACVWSSSSQVNSLGMASPKLWHFRIRRHARSRSAAFAISASRP